MNTRRLISRLMLFVMAALLEAAITPVMNQSLLLAQPSASADTTVVPRGMVRVTWARALRALRRGDTLRTEDFSLADTVIVWPWNTTPETAAQPGWLVKRALAAGEFMRTPSVAPLSVITTGSTVKILWQEGGVRLTLSGVATNNAALGAPVGVRIDRNRRLDGIAVGPNSVRLR
ncbi:MAG: flagellar basal body P-ring formation chaperone FlgA [Gemmatimonadaceae bacterium]